MASFAICRLCSSVIAKKKVVNLFSSAGTTKKLAARISTLLQVEEPRPDDSYSKNICEKCKGKVESLEKAVEQLHSFREMAKNALMNKGLKRTKETSGQVAVSPDTVRQRPPSKLARKKLNFGPESESEILPVPVSSFHDSFATATQSVDSTGKENDPIVSLQGESENVVSEIVPENEGDDMPEESHDHLSQGDESLIILATS